MKSFVLSVLMLATGMFSAFSQTVVLQEDFESAPYNVTPSGTPTWAINSRVQAAGSYCDSSTIGLSSTTYLTTNAFSTTGNSNVILEFKHICKIEINDVAQIEYSINGGAWTTITQSSYLGSGSFASNKFSELSYPTDWQASNATALPTNTWWKTEHFDLSALVGNQASVMLRFKMNDADNDGPSQRTGWYLDDIKVTIAPSELVPPTITLLPIIYQDTVYSTGPFEIKAAVSDASGIDTAYLVYSINAGPNDTLPMTVLLADTFHAIIPAQAYNTRIDYHVAATDAASAANHVNSSNYWFFLKQPAPVVIVGTGTSTSNLLPVNGLYDYSWSNQIYTAAEIGMSGFIDSIFFNVASVTSGYTFNNQSIFIESTTQGSFSGAAFPVTTGMTQIYSGNYTFTGAGWAKIALSTPFFYNGTDNLRIVWLNNDGSWTSGYPSFYYTSTSPVYDAQYSYDDGSMPASGSSTYDRPNIKIAFQLNNNNNDVAMMQMTEPLSTPTPATGTPYPVKVIFRNVGLDTLTSVTINWSVDGVIQTPYSWNGSLLQDQNSAELTLGTATFAVAGSHVIKAWSSLPNGVADENPVNDTLSRSYYACSNILAGNYTIDPMVPTGGTNFQYFSDVINALATCGINDTTVFNIVPGTYDTLLSIPVILGAGPTADVTFQSSTGVASDVILRNNATSTTDNYVFKLNGTDYFKIRNMSIQALGNNYANCILMNNNCKDVLIEGNIISGKDTTIYDDNLNLIYKAYSSVDSTIVIRNNSFNYGSTSIYMDNDYTTTSSNISVTGNTITNYTSAGIYISYSSEITIDTNTVNSPSATDYSYGVYVSDCENVNIRMNRIYNATYAAVYVSYVTNSAAGSGNIINNFMSSGGSGDSYGLYLNQSSNFKIVHNSANCYSSSGSYAYALYNYYGSGNNIVNNIFANTGNGMAICMNYTSDTSDYNNLYSNGSSLAEYDYSTYSDLATYQAASFMDLNSVSSNPMFVNNTELHTLAFANNDQGIGIGVLDDIDGEIRNLTTPDMGADEFTPPLQEAGIIAVLSPVSGCGMGLETVQIQIRNNGLDTIDGNLTAYYTVDGGTPVSQAVTNQILPNDTLDFSFTTPVDLSVGALDQTFVLNTYISLTGDPIPVNDTLPVSITSMHSPSSVSVSNATIPYATSTTLLATSADTVQWYADSMLTQFLFTGAAYTTPVLYDTTVYYVASTSAVNYTYTFDSDLQGWSALTPCSSYTSYNWAWDSDAGTGTAWMTDPSVNSSAVLLSPALNVFGNEVNLSYRHRYATESCCDGGYVAYRIDGGAWNLFIPATGAYTSTSGISVDPYFGSCGYSTTSIQSYRGTAAYETASGTIQLNGGTQIEIAFVFASDGSVGNSGWFIDEVSVFKPGCPGQVSPDTVFVTGTPAVDVGVVAIDEPTSGIELTAEPVTIKVRNFGTTAASNIPVSFSINGGTPVSETLAGPVAPGDTAVYNFVATADLSAYTTHHVDAFTSFTGDLYFVNDTFHKAVTNDMLPYCTSAALYTGDEDIGNVTFSTINNTSPAPHLAVYTNFTQTVPPGYLALGQTYPISVTIVDDASSYYSGYCEVYIDYNHDGVFTEPSEVVFGSNYSAGASVTVSGNVTIPLTATSCNTRMRVVVVEGGTAASVVPCGTYYYGETEDYIVFIAPQIPLDAGVSNIVSPAYIQAQGSSVPVIITVQNYGTDTLTTIPVEYVANGGAPVAYTWTGSLAPNSTTQITMPNVTVLPDSNLICAYTLVAGDTNTFNDENCAYFFGLPPSVLIEDDMEGGTLLYTDAPTLWEYGAPTATVINTPHSPDNVWATKLNGNYPNSATGYLYTPAMNFFGISGAYLTFYYWIDAQENYDGGFVQYSVNNGTSWSALGDINDVNGFNWFDSYVSGTPGWSKNTGGWKPAFLLLDAVSGYSTVKFRFGFKSNTSEVHNGFAIDDFKILGPQVAVDAGVVEVLSPVASGATGSQVTVKVRIQNFGTDVLTSIPVSYAINTGYPPQNGTWTGSLASGDTTTFTFTQTYPQPVVNYRLCAYTKLTSDPYHGNDSTCVLLDDVVGLADADIDGVSLKQNVPNPASGQTEIVFTLPEPGKCVFTFRNMLGEVILRTQVDGIKGKNSLLFEASELQQGMYMYTLEYKDVVLTKRLSVMR